MGSIADDLRRESAQVVAGLTATERIALALRLGDEDVAVHRTVHGTTEGESRAAFRRARAIGRVPSRSNESESR